MRVAIDATAIGSGLGGDETLVAGILRGLAARADPGDRFVVLTSPLADLPDEIVDHPAFEIQRRPRRSGSRHFTVELSRWLATLDPVPDAVLTNTHAPAWSPAPVALMLPDLSFQHHPDFFPRSTRLRLRTLVPRQARRAGVVLTISEFSRQDLLQAYGLEPSRVVVVPLTIDRPIALAPADHADGRRWLADQGVDGPFLLYLGNLHPRKNVARAIRAFVRVQAAHPELSMHRFVVAGGRWFSGSDEEEAAASAPPGRVVFVGRVDEHQRELLLRDAAALVYLSRFEGFGLPPLEAMARETPVLASNVTSIPEVCGDAALLVDPLDNDAIDAGLAEVLLDAERRAALVAAGRVRAADYDVNRTGTAVHAALGSLCERTSAGRSL